MLENKNLDALFVIVPILIIGIFVFALVMILSPKLRGKMMSRQVKSLKHMIDESADDFTSIGKTVGRVEANVRKGILDENEDTLKNVEAREADLDAIRIEKKANALKKGFSSNPKETIYCKHCGKSIDSDSTFCSKCGKKQ